MATSSVTQLLQGIRDTNNSQILQRVLGPLVSSLNSSALVGAGLAITGAGGTTAKIGANAFVGTVNGAVVTLPAGTVMPPLVGTVVNATWNVFCFFANAAGVVTSAMGKAGASQAAVKFPDFPPNTVLVGFISIHPTGAGNFVGGTTPLDDAGVIPNAVYISPTGSFNPNITP